MGIEEVSRLVSEGKADIDGVPAAALKAKIPELHLERAQLAIGQALVELLGIREAVDITGSVAAASASASDRAVTLFTTAGRGSEQAEAVDMISGAQVMHDTADRLVQTAAGMALTLGDIITMLEAVVPRLREYEAARAGLQAGTQMLADLQPTVVDAAGAYLHNISGGP